MSSSKGMANNDEGEGEISQHPIDDKDKEPTRGLGKSSIPTNPDDEQSPGQSKKIKLAATTEAGETEKEEENPANEIIQEMEEPYDDDDELSSETSEDHVMCAISSDRDVAAILEESRPQYEVLSPADIVSNMRECIKTASSVIQLPCTTMRVLLNHYGWDQQRLLEAYYAGGDAERKQFFQEAGVVDPQENAVGDNAVSSSTSGSEEECGVCSEDKPTSDMFALECGHRFCTACWTHYLETQIKEEGVGQTISCVATNCKVFVNDETVMKMITDAQVRVKYQQLITNSFVQCNRLTKWCPFPSCVYAVRVCDAQTRTVTCKCGGTFCFKCTEGGHDPIECDMRSKWLKKCADDSETCNWIAVNTKDCPKCKARIEKNGGCNHMECKACHTHFCWICLGSWSNHNSLQCNRYNETAAQRKEQQQSRAALTRYLFYFNRYANHSNSLKLEKDLGDLVNNKMVEMQNSMGWVEVQFLKEAVEVLCRCRQTLMYTYVFAYYVKKRQDNNQIEIFGGNQEDLQSSTEKLSGFLERNVIESDNLTTLKQQVQDMYKYCESRRQVLLDHVREGYENDWWEFID